MRRGDHLRYLQEEMYLETGVIVNDKVDVARNRGDKDMEGDC